MDDRDVQIEVEQASLQAASPSDFVSRRVFGDVEIALVQSAFTHWDADRDFERGRDWRSPEIPSDEDGRAVICVQWLCVRTPEAVVLVDPSSWSAADETIFEPFARLEPGRPIAKALDVLDVRPEDVTHVLVSHAHLDHFSGLRPGDDGLPRFPNAEHFFPAQDWEEGVTLERFGDPATFTDCFGAAERDGRLRLVEGDLQVGPGITMLHAPGETAGHKVTRIETGERTVYYLGDLFHFPAEFEQLELVPRHRLVPELIASRRRILADAGPGSLLVYTHRSFPGWCVAEQTGPDSYRVSAEV